MTKQRIIVLLAVIISIGIIMFQVSFRSNADTIQPAVEDNRSDGSSKSITAVNNSQNSSNNSANGVVSIPLKRPPFIKDK